MEAQQYIATSDCPEYLKKAEQRLSEEVMRVAHYLDPSTEARITAVVESEMVSYLEMPLQCGSKSFSAHQLLCSRFVTRSCICWRRTSPPARRFSIAYRDLPRLSISFFLPSLVIL